MLTYLKAVPVYLFFRIESVIVHCRNKHIIAKMCMAGGGQVSASAGRSAGLQAGKCIFS